MDSAVVEQKFPLLFSLEYLIILKSPHHELGYLIRDHNGSNVIQEIRALSMSRGSINVGDGEGAPTSLGNKIGGKRVGRNRIGVTTKEFVRPCRYNAPRSAGGRSDKIIIKGPWKERIIFWGDWLVILVS